MPYENIYAFNRDRSKATIPSDLAEIRQQLNAISDAVDNVETDIGVIRGSIATLDNSLTNLENRVHALEEDEGGSGGGGGGGGGGVIISGYDPATYAGQDLTTVFADEITTAGDVTAWLSARVAAGNFDGMHVRDYIDITLTNSTVMRYRIMDFDHDIGCGSSAEVTTHHIDMCPDQPYSTDVQWNTSSGRVQYSSSNIKTVLTTTFLSLLPTAWQDILVDREVMMGNAWKKLGKVWVPSEVEIFGYPKYWENLYGPCDSDMHYADFFKKPADWIRKVNGTRVPWWTRTPADNTKADVSYTNSIIVVGYKGEIGISPSDASSGIKAVPCFRVGA